MCVRNAEVHGSLSSKQKLWIYNGAGVEGELHACTNVVHRLYSVHTFTIEWKVMCGYVICKVYAILKVCSDSKNG